MCLIPVSLCEMNLLHTVVFVGLKPCMLSHYCCTWEPYQAHLAEAVKVASPGEGRDDSQRQTWLRPSIQIEHAALALTGGGTS